MIITVDPGSATPIYAQIVAAVTAAVSAGDLAPGERLPGAEELAAGLDLNRNTVLRAYRRLRDTGVIELRRGRGATVRRAPSLPAAVAAALDELATVAREAGTPLDTLVGALACRGVA